MKKTLLAGVIALAPFAAFADYNPSGVMANGNIGIANAASSAGVASTQGTVAGSAVKGNGMVVNGAVAGNYTAVQTTGKAKATPVGAETKTTAQQTNIGGTITGGYADTGRGWGNTASGVSGATQNSQATGASTANATALGGSIKVQEQRNGHRSR